MKSMKWPHSWSKTAAISPVLRQMLVPIEPEVKKLMSRVVGLKLALQFWSMFISAVTGTGWPLTKANAGSPGAIRLRKTSIIRLSS